MNAQDNARTTTPARGRGYLNAILTANAVLLGVIALNATGLTGPWTSVSHAQSPGVAGDPEDSPTARTSAAEQRKQIIAALHGVQVRLDRMEATMNKGLSVKVTNFPADFGQGGSGRDAKVQGEKPPMRGTITPR